MSGGGDEELERANVTALAPVYEQWSRGNWRPRFDVYADDFEWGWSEEFPELRGVALDPESRVLGRVRGEPEFGGRYASAWLHDLGGADPTTRALAGEQLRLGGADAVPVLTFVLTAHTTPEARWRAADVVGQIGPDARPAGPALVGALKDPDPTVRSVAARSLEKLAPDVPGAVPALIALFPEVDAVRAVAADIARDFAAAHRETDQREVMQFQLHHELVQVLGEGVVIVA